MNNLFFTASPEVSKRTNPVSAKLVSPAPTKPVSPASTKPVNPARDLKLRVQPEVLMTNIAEQRNLDNIGFKISSKNAKLFQRKDIPVVIFPEEVEPAFWNVLKIDNKMKDLKQKKKEEKSKKAVVESTSPFFRMSNFKSKRFAGKPKQTNESKSDCEKVKTKDRQSPPSKIETVKKAENPRQNVRHSPPSKTQMVENKTENKARQSPPSKSEKTERKGLKRKPDFDFETADKRSKLSHFDSTEVVSSKKDEPTIKDLFEKKRNGLQQEPTSFNKSRQDSSSSNKSRQDSTSFSKSRQDSTSFSKYKQEPTSFYKSQQEPTSFSKPRLDPTSFNKSRQDSTSLNKSRQDSTSLNKSQQQDLTSFNKMNGLHNRADGKITSEYFESFENEVDYNTDEYNRHTNGDNRNKDVENRHTNVENRDKTEEHRSKHKEEYYRKMSDDEYRSKNKDERHANVENGNKDVEHRSKHKEHEQMSEEYRNKHKEEHRKMSEEYRSKKRDKTEAKRSSKDIRKKENFSGVKGFCLDCDGCEVGCQHFDHSRILFRDLEVHQRINRNHTRFQPVNTIFI